VLCWACAVVRWLEVLDVAVTKIATAAVARLLKAAPEVTSRSAHVCREPLVVADSTAGTPLMSPVDQWGALPFPGQRLTPHSLSRRVRNLLIGDLGAHRSLMVDPELAPVAEQQPATAPARAVYGREDSQRAWARRRADLADLAGVEDLLNKVDARARELQQRTAALLAAEADR
jgi:hypothetical protein